MDPQAWTPATVQRYLTCTTAQYLPGQDFFVKFYGWTNDEFLHAKSIVDGQLEDFTQGDDLLVIGDESRLAIERALVSRGQYLFDHRQQRRHCTWFVDDIKKSPHGGINKQCVNQLFISWCKRSYRLKRRRLRQQASLLAMNARTDGNAQTPDPSSTAESQFSSTVDDTPSEVSTPTPTLPGVRDASAPLSSLTPAFKRRRSMTESDSAVSRRGPHPRLWQGQAATDQSSKRAVSSTIAVLSLPSQILEQFNRPHSPTHDSPRHLGRKRDSNADDPTSASRLSTQTLPMEVTLKKLMVFAVLITTRAERRATVTILDRTKYFRVGQLLNDSTGRVNFQQLKDFATRNIEGYSIYWVSPSQNGIQILPIADEYAAEIAFETLHESVSRDRTGPVQIFVATSEQLVSGVPREELCRRGDFETRVVLRKRDAATWWSWAKNLDGEVNDSTGLLETAAER